MADSTSESSALISDVALVRQTLMRELETINAYEAYSRQATSDEVRTFLAHLAAEEKEHVAEATALMRRLDAEQDRLFEAEGGPEHYASGTHTHAGAEAPARPAPRTAPQSPPHAFTVGSLRGRQEP